MSRSVLIVAAHPDDEVLGCGGTIAKHVATGDTVSCVFLADGVSSRENSSPGELAVRQNAALTAAKLLGISNTIFCGFPDNSLDGITLLTIVKKLESLIDTLQPDVIYTHHSGDLNIDHQIAHKAVLIAVRPLPGSRVTEVYSFEVPSSTEWGEQPFEPEMFVDISDYLTIKLSALEAYEYEMREVPHARSIENVVNLARWRGNSVGLMAAEAMKIIRAIV